ncbi:DUF1488 family protein [Ralstonia soli]|uniref:DUF1488 domain-containing protein n=1 Tax=Ralstonia soli TaxID=2953896 RepID=A0ABT1AFH0_9RALS|nr:DUF1488 family protein [Ralstonia soli]MCO5396957.1 DUF1488 domain-containing protein [Ralstonia soli]
MASVQETAARDEVPFTTGSPIMQISFTGRTFRSVGDLIIQAVVNNRVVSCIVTSEALALCARGYQGVSVEEVYLRHRERIEQAASGLIRAGRQAPVMVCGHALMALDAPSLKHTHGATDATIQAGPARAWLDVDQTTSRPAWT